jgi:hypothetical protein
MKGMIVYVESRVRCNILLVEMSPATNSIFVTAILSGLQAPSCCQSRVCDARPVTKNMLLKGLQVRRVGRSNISYQR